jgi:hypothetical protein
MGGERPTSLTPTSRFTIRNQCFIGGYPPGKSAQASGHSWTKDFERKFNSSEEQSELCEVGGVLSPKGHLVRPAALKPRGYRFEYRSEQSFAEIVKNEKTKRSQDCFADFMPEPNGPYFVSQKCTGAEKTEFIESKASTMIPRKTTLGEEARKSMKTQAMQTLQSVTTSKPLATTKRSHWIGPRKL